MNLIFLNDHNKIPIPGFGTFLIKSELAAKSVSKAIEVGYRHIDTAAIYKNEKEVGLGIKQSRIDRQDLFVTSKVWNTSRGYDTTLKACHKTLDDLQLDYLDLYLIHWPANAKQFDNWRDINSETWRAMEKLQKDGLVKSIGVSNFMAHHMKNLLLNAKVKPAVNQIEFHPGYQQNEAVIFSKENDILIEAWGPLGQGRLLDNKTIVTIAEKHHKSSAQVCLRWVIQNGHIPLVKSISEDRMKENLAIFDFNLSDEDMQILNNLSEQAFSGVHPDKVDF